MTNYPASIQVSKSTSNQRRSRLRINYLNRSKHAVITHSIQEVMQECWEHTLGNREGY